MKSSSKHSFKETYRSMKREPAMYRYRGIPSEKMHAHRNSYSVLVTVTRICGFLAHFAAEQPLAKPPAVTAD